MRCNPGGARAAFPRRQAIGRIQSRVARGEAAVRTQRRAGSWCNGRWVAARRTRGVVRRFVVDARLHDAAVVGCGATWAPPNAPSPSRLLLPLPRGRRAGAGDGRKRHRKSWRRKGKDGSEKGAGGGTRCAQASKKATVRVQLTKSVSSIGLVT